MLHAIYSILTQTHGAPSVMAVLPLVWAGILAAANAAKAATSDKQRADQERKYEAETARWSPWTHMASHYVAAPDVAGAALGGGLTGFSLGQNANNQEAINKLILARAAEEGGRGTASSGEESEIQGQIPYEGAPYSPRMQANFLQQTPYMSGPYSPEMQQSLFADFLARNRS